MPIRSIHAKAPTRIDLAGGTVDLWPLYLFLKDPVTINLGIDLFAEATIEQSGRSDGETGNVTLRSEDQGHELKFPWSALFDAKTSAPPQLELHLKLLRHFARQQQSKGFPTSNYHFSLSTRAKSPAGAGLGGSSTLSVAMIAALASWTKGAAIDPMQEGEHLVDITRDVETTVIQVPAGVQDYYGAMFGGLQSLKWGPGKHFRDWLPSDILPEVEKRLLLFYSGQSRNSGINNWALFKAFIDRVPGTREKFEAINRATQKLEVALRAHDWKSAGAAIQEEWQTRKSLAPGITTHEIDQAFETAAAVSPVSGKICGAGGGGCFFMYLDDPSMREEVAQAVEKVPGIRRLPFRAVPRGVDITVSNA